MCVLRASIHAAVGSTWDDVIVLLQSEVKLASEEHAFVRLEHSSKCALCEKRIGAF